MDISNIRPKLIAKDILHLKEPSSAETAKTSSITSFEHIRFIRQEFEQETQPMQQSMGSGKHQTLLMAMYEGTEHLFNKEVTDFELTTYLQSLKNHARTLHTQGVSLEEFRSTLFRQSQDTIVEMLQQI